jgi:DNA replication protein DnaC
VSAPLAACACGAPSARDGVCDRCFQQQLDEVRAKSPARPVPSCTDCGRHPGSRPDGLCSACRGQRLEAERVELEATERARVEERRRALEASPHRCEGGCGLRTLRPGVSCEPCRVRLAAERERTWRVELTRECLPARYRWCGFDAPELAARVSDARAIAKARAAVEAGADRLLFTGDGAGVGKTVLASCCLLAYATVRGLHGRFVDAQALAHARALAPLGAEPPDVVAAFEADALVLDELGADKPIHNSPIAEVLHRRHADMRLTIVTTGFTVEELGQRYGDGIARRLAEDAATVHVRKGRARA